MFWIDFIARLTSLGGCSLMKMRGSMPLMADLEGRNAHPGRATL